MNAIVAIGGSSLTGAVAAYRALVPSAVWVLGMKTPRDPRDQLVRSLESLVEPFMEEYFANEARAQVAALSAHLTTLLLPARNLDPNRVLSAVSPTMWQDVAAALALVAMLDRAHATQPVELVLIDDGSAKALTAVAWAQARGLPSMTVPAGAPLQRPRKPSADRTVVVGDRMQRAFAALDVANSQLLRISSQAGLEFGDREARRISARSAVSAALGWSESDLLVVFEPAPSVRISALEPANAVDKCLQAVCTALVLASVSVPNLRLAINDPSSLNAQMKAAQAASSAGLAADKFAYSNTDHALWMAAADISVSVESTRSIDAAVAGVPALNLWQAANWYLGPSFTAEDGVLDVQPDALAATFVALAHDPGLRKQISAIATDHLAFESIAGARVASAIAIEASKLRRPAKRNLRPGKAKLDIVVYAPDYSHASAGIRSLYRLCHLINLAGGNASMYPPTRLHPEWNTPRRDTDLTERTIVIYPEIYHMPLPAKRIVRWVLNEPGLLAGPKSYGAEEMVFYFDECYREAAQAATGELLTPERELQVAIVEPELFYNDRSKSRLYDCVFTYKGRELYDRVQPREIRDAYVIQSGWPATRNETAALLRGCRRLYSFDWRSAIMTEALICGAEVFIVGHSHGELVEVRKDTSDYVREYYDLSKVQRFLELIGDRWN